MAYFGQTVPIPLAQEGLRTDDVSTTLPPTSLSTAKNIRFVSSRIEKAPGSTKFNATALTGAIVGLFDWWPTGLIQRLIAVTANGRIWRDTGNGTFSASTPIDSSFGAPTTDFMFVPAGNENASQNRKLFLFSSTHQLSYIDGDGTSVTTSATPAADWATVYPTGGFVFQNRLVAFGNSNFPHQLYISDDADHAKFDAGDVGTLSVFPGEGEKILAGFVYKGVAFLLKWPTGLYRIVAQTATFTSWYVEKIDASFGLSSPNALIQMLNDLVAGNNTGSITSMKAVEALGDIESGDVLANAQIESYIRTNTDVTGIPFQHALYYPQKKLAWFTYYLNGGTTNNFNLEIDVNRPNPRFSINTRDVMNVLALRKDSNKIQRPIYGTKTGFVYIADTSSVYSIDSSPYVSEFQTQDMDFSFLDPRLANSNKIFDFLTLIARPQGITTIYCDVIIDGSLRHTISFPQTSSSALDTFVLDVDALDGGQLAEDRQPIYGSGKRIAFRVYDNDDIPFKIEQLLVSFRLGDESEQPGDD